MSKRHRISKWGLAYHSKFTPWKKRAARGHERAAQKRVWEGEITMEQAQRINQREPLRLRGFRDEDGIW